MKLGLKNSSSVRRGRGKGREGEEQRERQREGISTHTKRERESKEPRVGRQIGERSEGGGRGRVNFV